MKAFWYFIMVFSFAAGGWAAEGWERLDERARFATYDVYLDPKGEPLAAYQLRIWATNGTAQIVGIEGGDHAAFREPPTYDPKAMRREKIVLAAWSTAKKLPKEKTRVASLHVRERAGVEFGWELQAAATPSEKIRNVAVKIQKRVDK